MYENVKKSLEKLSLKSVFTVYPEENGYSILQDCKNQGNLGVGRSNLASLFQTKPEYSTKTITEIKIIVKGKFNALSLSALDALAKEEEFSHTISWLNHHNIEHRVEEHGNIGHVFVVADAALGIEFEISDAEISHRAEQWSDMEINQ